MNCDRFVIIEDDVHVYNEEKGKWPFAWDSSEKLMHI